MSIAPAEAALAAIDSLRGTLGTARALAQNGRRIDLAGLDAEAVLCAAVTLLPRAAARGLRPALEALLRELDGLAASLPGPDVP